MSCEEESDEAVQLKHDENTAKKQRPVNIISSYYICSGSHPCQ
jgi:hypothetical protein